MFPLLAAAASAATLPWTLEGPIVVSTVPVSDQIALVVAGSQAQISECLTEAYGPTPPSSQAVIHVQRVGGGAPTVDLLVVDERAGACARRLGEIVGAVLPEGNTQVWLGMRVAGGVAFLAPFNSALEPIVLGAMDKARVDEVVAAQASAISRCAAGAPNPSKLIEKFVVAKDGTVSVATTKVTTIDNPAIESCISSVFMGMTFPPPKGGGIVIVSYPLTFGDE